MLRWFAISLEWYLAKKRKNRLEGIFLQRNSFVIQHLKKFVLSIPFHSQFFFYSPVHDSQFCCSHNGEIEFFFLANVKISFHYILKSRITLQLFCILAKETKMKGNDDSNSEFGIFPRRLFTCTTKENFTWSAREKIKLHNILTKSFLRMSKLNFCWPEWVVDLQKKKWKLGTTELSLLCFYLIVQSYLTLRLIFLFNCKIIHHSIAHLHQLQHNGCQKLYQDQQSCSCSL